MNYSDVNYYFIFTKINLEIGCDQFTKHNLEMINVKNILLLFQSY